MMFNLPIVPGITFTQVKPYHHRRKYFDSAGYRGHIHNDGRIHVWERGRHRISITDAWQIDIRNTGSTTVDVILVFSIHDQYGELRRFTAEYRNLRPGEPAERHMERANKSDKIMFEAVEVYANDQQISVTEVKQFLPSRPFVGKNWIYPVLIFYVSLAALHGQYPKDVSGSLPGLAVILAVLAMMNRTPVLLMVILILMIPFTAYGILFKLGLFCLAAGYLYAVWTKRGSIRDFLRTTTSPE